jgi:ABC-type phosphate transport system permease subunit
MEITSFILGMLTVVGMAAAILLVIGMVKIYKQKSTIANLQEQLNFVQQQSYTAVETLETHLYQNLDELRREYSSYVDSRIDKLQSKTKMEATTN